MNRSPKNPNRTIENDKSNICLNSSEIMHTHAYMCVLKVKKGKEKKKHLLARHTSTHLLEPNNVWMAERSVIYDFSRHILVNLPTNKQVHR